MISGGALGLMETIGLTAAAAALDAALKAADVKCVGVEKVIGVDKTISVTVSITGDVASVQAAVDAGVNAANAVGKVYSSRVIPRPHSDVDKLIELFRNKVKDPDSATEDAMDDAMEDAMDDAIEVTEHE